MKKWIRNTSIVTGVTVTICAIGLLGYRSYFSMGKVESYAINSEKEGSHFVIATQQSSFKDAVMLEVEEKLETSDSQVSVIDISELNKLDQSSCDGVYILTTIESGDVPSSVKDFISTASIPINIATTAQSERWDDKPDNVDVITQASLLSNVPNFSEDILNFINHTQ